MALSDFLSRQKIDDSNCPEIIPISFSLRRVLHENYYKLDSLTETSKIETDKYLVQTRSQIKSSGIKVPEVHGIYNGLIPHVKPEHQKSVVTQPTHQTQPIDKDCLQTLYHPYPSLELDKEQLELEESLR